MHGLINHYHLIKNVLVIRLCYRKLNLKRNNYTKELTIKLINLWYVYSTCNIGVVVYLRVQYNSYCIYEKIALIQEKNLN